MIIVPVIIMTMPMTITMASAMTTIMIIVHDRCPDRGARLVIYSVEHDHTSLCGDHPVKGHKAILGVTWGVVEGLPMLGVCCMLVDDATNAARLVPTRKLFLKCISSWRLRMLLEAVF